jgi:hypothetical protein
MDGRIIDGEDGEDGMDGDCLGSRSFGWVETEIIRGNQARRTEARCCHAMRWMSVSDHLDFASSQDRIFSHLPLGRLIPAYSYSPASITSVAARSLSPRDEQRPSRPIPFPAVPTVPFSFSQCQSIAHFLPFLLEPFFTRRLPFSPIPISTSRPTAPTAPVWSTPTPPARIPPRPCPGTGVHALPAPGGLVRYLVPGTLGGYRDRRARGIREITV